MSVIDKHGILGNLLTRQRVVLELGCGNRKSVDEAICIDVLDYDCVDLVGDVYEVLAALPDGVADSIVSSHFVEHVADVSLLLDELARVLKAGGKLAITVPHFSNPYYYSDITHRTAFGLYSMSYFALDHRLARKVPTYKRDVAFELASVHLGFKSSPPFFLRHALKKLIGVFVNLNGYTRELYEEWFCYWFPCYEVHYELRKLINTDLEVCS